MAITRSFGGQTLLKPGAYSVSRVDNAQGIAVGENNTLMLIGEASDGVPGTIENSRTFSNIQQLIDYYVSGDIVDAALAAGRPSLTPGISAPTNFIVYKSNPSQFATHQIAFGNGAAGQVSTAATAVQIVVTYPINASGESITETITTAELAIGSTPRDFGNAVRTALLANTNLVALFNIGALESADVDNAQVPLVAIKAGPQFGPLNITGDPMINPAGRVSIIATFVTTPGNITVAENDGANTAADGTGTVSNALTANLLAQTGATTLIGLASAFTDAFNFDPNVIVPLWSNPVLGVVPVNSPNAGTNFVAITAPLAAASLQSHLIQRSSVSVRKEAQGMIGIRNADWRTAFATGNAEGIASITSFLIQAFIQDVRIVDSFGALTWKAPHIQAAMAAGVRLGSTVGEPLTFKVLNANGVGHNINTSTGQPAAAATQFRPGFDFNEAITEGITFSELASGGNRIVVDNTRYETDESFVFNRGSVIEAAQFVARTSRQLLERIFVGQKVSNGAALSLKNVLRNYLIQLNTDNIITSSSDAPFGFVESTFTVTINGNTAAIQVEVKPVQGLDFIFIDFTLGNITQSA